MPGNCKFQEKWLDNVEYKDWLHKDSLNIHNAKCSICHKSFSVSSMGEHSVISLSRGRAASRRNSPQQRARFVPSES